MIGGEGGGGASILNLTLTLEQLTWLDGAKGDDDVAAASDATDDDAAAVLTGTDEDDGFFRPADFCMLNKRATKR